MPFRQTLAVLALALASCSSGGGAAALAVPTSAPAPASDATKAIIAPFLGSYVVVDREKSQRALEKAIEDIVQQLTFIIRGIARDKMSDAIHIAETIDITADDKILSITVNKTKIDMRLDGQAIPQTIENGELRAASIAFKGGLEQKLDDGDQGSVHRYVLSGDRLIMTTRIYSTQLPEDLVYAVELRRKGTPNGAASPTAPPPPAP